jgi:hypothetical protein
MRQMSDRKNGEEKEGRKTERKKDTQIKSTHTLVTGACSSEVGNPILLFSICYV